MILYTCYDTNKKNTKQEPPRPYSSPPVLSVLLFSALITLLTLCIYLSATLCFIAFPASSLFSPAPSPPPPPTSVSTFSLLILFCPPSPFPDSLPLTPPKPLIHSLLLKVKHSPPHCFSMHDTSVTRVSLSYSSHLSLLSSFSDSHPHVTPSHPPRSCRMISISVIVRRPLSCTIHFDFPLMSSF